MYSIRFNKRHTMYYIIGVADTYEEAEKHFNVQKEYSLHKGITNSRIQVVDETTKKVIFEDVGENY